MLGALLVAQIIIASYLSSSPLLSSQLSDDMKLASNIRGSGADTGEAGMDINIAAAVFSQAEDSESGIFFTYRIGPSPVAWFGASAVQYRLGNTPLQLAFPGSNVVVPRGINPLQSVTNYFKGSDPSKWQAGLVDYGAIVYDDLYLGIDLIYKITKVGLKYEFVVAPGADPGQIVLDFVNADLVEVEPYDLRAGISGEMIEDVGLIALQETRENSITVDCEFQQASDSSIKFVLGNYDASKALVIDPVVNVLSYSTLLGGAGTDQGLDIAVENGFVYLTGYTADATPDFPTTTGAYSTVHNSGEDVFVTKLNADGSSLVYSTFLGGFSNDRGDGIAVEDGFVYVTGQTNDAGTDYPVTTGANDTMHNGGIDVFVTKLSADGSSLVYSTFLGGSMNEFGRDIAVENGFAYVVGNTASSGYPTTPGAYNETINSGFDVFVTKMSADGSSLLYSTFVGGSHDDDGNAIAVENGFTYITGFSFETTIDYPTTPGAYNETINGGYDAFVTKLSTDGSSLVYSTFIGGSVSNDHGQGIAVENDIVYITGYTSNATANYPTTTGAYDKIHDGGYDVFVTKLSAGGNSLLYSTFLGGSAGDYGRGIAVENGLVYITGNTVDAATDYPTTAGAYCKTHTGGDDVFVTKLGTDGSSLVYSTLLGSSGTDYGFGIAIENSIGYITGYTVDAPTDYPTTAGAYDITHNGGQEAFVTKLDADADNDGMPDGWEITHGLNPSTVDAILDGDNDDLSNIDEYIRGTLPDNPDTDGDLANDGDEVAAGTDPLDGASHPNTDQSDISFSVADYIILGIAGLACVLAVGAFTSGRKARKQSLAKAGS